MGRSKGVKRSLGIHLEYYALVTISLPLLALSPSLPSSEGILSLLQLGAESSGDEKKTSIHPAASLRHCALCESRERRNAGFEINSRSASFFEPPPPFTLRLPASPDPHYTSQVCRSTHTVDNSLSLRDFSAESSIDCRESPSRLHVPCSSSSVGLDTYAAPLLVQPYSSSIDRDDFSQRVARRSISDSYPLRTSTVLPPGMSTPVLHPAVFLC